MPLLLVGLKWTNYSAFWWGAQLVKASYKMPENPKWQNHTKLHGGMHDISFCKLGRAPSEITSSQLLSSLLCQSCCSGSSFLLKEIRGKCYSSCNKAGLLELQQRISCKACAVLLTSCSVMSDSLATPWSVTSQALLSVGFWGKNTEVSCNFLLQWIFPTKGSNPHLFASSTLAGKIFTTVPLGKLLCKVSGIKKH